MKLYRYLILAIAVFSVTVSLNTAPGLAEGNAAKPDETLSLGEPDILWLWGEVNSIDSGKGIISIKYLDYETDTEKEAVIYADDKTTYENAKSLTDIKPKDIVSVDYVTGAQGSSIARNISVERPEDTQAMGEGTALDEELKPPAAGDVTLPREEAAEDNIKQ
jgi:hypothetical protein